MPTDNHGLNTPAEGQTDWHIPLNNNFEKIDEILKNISSDGETVTPENIAASNINGVRIASDATEIQSHIDALDGTVTGYDQQDSADRPGGGLVLLKRGKYVPSSTIVLKQGVVLAGIQPESSLGRNNHEWSYSVISGENVPSGDPIIKTEHKRGHHSQIRNLVVSGAGRDVDGIFIDHTSNTKVVNCAVARCYGHGYHARGSLDTFLLDSVIQGGDYSNGTYAVYFTSENDQIGSGSWDVQAEVSGLIAKSDGKSKTPNGNTAFRNESSLIIIDGRTQITTKNANDVGVASFYNAGGGTPVRIHGVNFTSYEKEGSHCIENHGSVYLSDCVIQKGDIGMIEEGKSNSLITNCIFERNRSHGLYIRGGASTGSIANSKFRANGGSGIMIENAKVRQPWSSITCKSNGGYGLENDSVRNGQIPVISGFHASKNTDGAISDPAQAWIEQVSGYYNNEKKGRQAFSGDGSTTSFQVTHRMDEQPVLVTTSPLSEEACIPSYISSKDASTFEITFTTAPSSGTRNIDFDWYAAGPSAVPK